MPSPLVAFGFQSLPMLGWLAAAAVPILIHFWSRRKYRETSWAAMEYLLAAMRQHARRLRFEQLLLLLLRTLAIVLVATAAAEPFFDRGTAVATAHERVHRTLVIDASYSMSFRTQDHTRLDTAKQLARQIVERSAQGDAFTLVVAAEPPRVVIGTPALAANDVVREIDGVGLVHTAFDLAATVAAIEQVMATAQKELPRIDRHEVVFLTDLGRVGWKPAISTREADELRSRLARLGQSVSLRLVDLGQPTAENLAITELGALEPIALLGQSVSFSATLQNLGRQGRKAQRVEWFVDGRPAAQQAVDVTAGGGQATTTMSHRFETPGDHVVECTANGDALEIDNRRALVVPVRSAIRVLCIDGRPSGEALGGAAGYLAFALSPETNAANATTQVDVAGESALVERDLTRYDCVMLASVARFTPAEARILENYLRGGGGLVFFLGEGVVAENYNHELGPRGVNLLPAMLGDVVAQLQPRLDSGDFRHPLVRAFRGRGESSLLTTPVEKYFKLEIEKPLGAEVALRLADGDPLVVEAPVHRGRVVIVATSADPSWTPMPLWPSFVPLVHEIVAFCAAGEGHERNITVGEPFGSVLPPSLGETAPSVTGPDGHPRPVQVRRDPAGAAWTCSDTMLAGVYNVRFDTATETPRAYAAALDTVESDLAQIGIDELRSTVLSGVPFEVLSTWDGSATAASVVAPRSSGLSIGLLYAVLAMLVFETVLAWRLGNPR